MTGEPPPDGLHPPRPFIMRVRRRLVALGLALLTLVGTGCAPRVPAEQAAVDVLVEFYDARSGVWLTTGWWNSANALTALIDSMLTSGDERHRWVVENTWSRKRTAASGNFTNHLLDDTGWWALAWIRAYDLTGEERYLRTAQAGVEYMWRYHDDVCGGGLWWDTARTYKNAITSELFVKAAAELHQRLDREGPWLDRALRVWEWFEGSGMINDELLVNDGLTRGTCVNNGDVTWTYNQGVVLGALVALSDATEDASYLERARELADASTTADYLHRDGVLTEVCEHDGCGIDGPSFKGIYVRNLGELNRRLNDRPYQDYLRHQAEVVEQFNRTPDGRYGLHWAGPVAYVNGATQAAVVDLIVALRPVDVPPRPAPAEEEHTPTVPTPDEG